MEKIGFKHGVKICGSKTDAESGVDVKDELTDA